MHSSDFAVIPRLRQVVGNMPELFWASIEIKETNLQSNLMKLKTRFSKAKETVCGMEEKQTCEYLSPN